MSVRIVETLHQPISDTVCHCLIAMEHLEVKTSLGERIFHVMNDAPLNSFFILLDVVLHQFVESLVDLEIFLGFVHIWQQSLPLALLADVYRTFLLDEWTFLHFDTTVPFLLFPCLSFLFLNIGLHKRYVSVFKIKLIFLVKYYAVYDTKIHFSYEWIHSGQPCPAAWMLSSIAIHFRNDGASLLSEARTFRWWHSVSTRSNKKMS